MFSRVRILSTACTAFCLFIWFPGAALAAKKGIKLDDSVEIIQLADIPGVLCARANGKVSSGKLNKKGDRFLIFKATKKVKVKLKKLKKQRKRLRKKLKKNPTAAIEAKLANVQAKILKLSAKGRKAACQRAFTEKDQPAPAPTLPPGPTPIPGGGEERLTPFTGTVTNFHIDNLCNRAAYGCTNSQKSQLRNLASQGIGTVVDTLLNINVGNVIESQCSDYRDGDDENELPEGPPTKDGLNRERVCIALFSDAGSFERLFHFVRSVMLTLNYNTFGETPTEVGMLAEYSDEIRRLLKSGATLKQIIEYIAFSPAMLRFLDNESNNAVAPNENYARELWELETFGTDYLAINGESCHPLGLTGPLYNATDIAQSSLALTGWGILQGQTVEAPGRHAQGTKVIFGGTVEVENMQDVIDAIFEHRALETQQFWGYEFARYFITAEPNCVLARKVANALKDNNMDLLQTFRAILTSAEFHSPSNRGTIMKEIMESRVWASRTTGIERSVDQLADNLEDAKRMPEESPTVFYYFIEDLTTSDQATRTLNFIQDSLVNRADADDRAFLVLDEATAAQAIDRFASILGCSLNTDQRNALIQSLDTDENESGVQFNGTTDKTRAIRVALAAMLASVCGQFN